MKAGTLPPARPVVDLTLPWWLARAAVAWGLHQAFTGFAGLMP